MYICSWNELEREQDSERKRQQVRQISQHELDTPGGATSATACDTSHVFCGLQDGWSALILAIHKGHSAVADKLISAGAKLDLQNKVRENSLLCGE